MWARRKFTPLICSFRDSHSRPEADPDTPILKEAKAEYAKLQARAGVNSVPRHFRVLLFLCAARLLGDSRSYPFWQQA